MKLAIIMGSNRGSKSISNFFLQKLSKDWQIETIEVGKYIKVFSESREFFNDTLQSIKDADGVLWFIPVHNMLPSSEICSFIQLMDRYEAFSCLENKYTSAVFTSFYFSHREAEEYWKLACQSWNMNTLDVFHCRVDFFLDNKEIQRWESFADLFYKKVKSQFPCQSYYEWNQSRILPYTATPGLPVEKRNPSDKKVLLITTSPLKNSNLNEMISVWTRHFPYEMEVINLSELSFMLSCTSCMNCFWNEPCLAENDLLGKTIFPKYKEADAIIFATDIRSGMFPSSLRFFLDRLFLKAYFDRQKRKKVAYIFSGSLKNGMVVEKYIQSKSLLHGETLVGVVSDAKTTAKQITKNIITLVQAMTQALEDSHQEEVSDDEQNFIAKFENRVIIPLANLFLLRRHKCTMSFPFLSSQLNRKIYFKTSATIFKHTNKTKGEIYLKTIENLLTKK